MTDSKAVTKAPDPLQNLEDDLLSRAKSPQERQTAYALISRAKQIDMVRRAALALAEKGWGADISPLARAAVVRYCWEIGADPSRHVFVLGGNVFINGTFYREAVASEPDFLRVDDPLWIHHDKRLSDDVAAERAALRIAHNIPDECPACCIITGYFKDRGPFKGIGRVRFGKTAKGHDKDPVGLEFPRESAETRAWRELGEKVVGPWLKTHQRKQEAEMIISSGRMVESVPELADLPTDAVAEKERLLARPTEPEILPTRTADELVADKTLAEPCGDVHRVVNGRCENCGESFPEPVAPEPEKCKHNPSAKCPIEGVHLLSECGYGPH